MSARISAFTPQRVVPVGSRPEITRKLALLGLAASLVSQAAMAQVTFADLGGFAEAKGAYGTYQVGNIGNSAALWSGSAASMVDLTPSGVTFGFATAMDGTKQAGYVEISGIDHAALWSSTAGSFEDLQPVGYDSSVAWGISGSYQAGWATIGGVPYAALWSGTADSLVNLNPSGATESWLRAASGSQQVGTAFGPSGNHAGLWSGTASSFVDLNPTGSAGSDAWAISGAQQAGEAFIQGREHASLWSGTAASFLDLNPAGATDSQIRGMSGTIQVGWASIGGQQRAALWRGTAGSFLDLQTILGSGFQSSCAEGIYYDGTIAHVAGYAYDSTGLMHATAWTVAVPEPARYSVAVGVGLFCFSVAHRCRRKWANAGAISGIPLG